MLTLFAAILHYWINCIIKGFLDTASFVGSNKTGVLFAIVLGGLSLGKAIRQHVKDHGWPRMSKDWLALAKSGLTNATWAFGIVWLLHSLAAPHGLYTEAEGRLKNASEAFAKERFTLTIERDSLRAQLNTSNTECAKKDGVNQTLQNQNRYQQATINGCLSQAMKLLTPAPQKLIALNIGEQMRSRNAEHYNETIILTNKSITPVRLLVACKESIIAATGSVLPIQLGGTIVGGGWKWGGKFNDHQFGVWVESPAWTPESPLLVTLFFNGRERLGECSFNVL
jgi:hypothetical protein